MPVTFFKWNDSLSLKIPEIDEQHKKLVDIINLLYEAFMDQTANERIPEIIHELNQYADYHFTTEEKYFDRFNYEQTEVHKKEHEKYIDKMKEFEEKYNRNPKALTYEMMNFLRNWWQDHIQGSDRDYQSCFKENGL